MAPKTGTAGLWDQGSARFLHPAAKIAGDQLCGTIHRISKPEKKHRRKKKSMSRKWTPRRFTGAGPRWTKTSSTPASASPRGSSVCLWSSSSSSFSGTCGVIGFHVKIVKLALGSQECVWLLRTYLESCPGQFQGGAVQMRGELAVGSGAEPGTLQFFTQGDSGCAHTWERTRPHYRAGGCESEPLVAF